MTLLPSKIHYFTGPTPKSTSTKLNNYKKAKKLIGKSQYFGDKVMPPYINLLLQHVKLPLNHIYDDQNIWKYIQKNLQDVKDKYNIATKVHTDRYVYCKVKRGMHGLKQAAWLAYDSPKNRWMNMAIIQTKSLQIYRVIENGRRIFAHINEFGVQYFPKQAATHLLNTLQENMQSQLNLRVRFLWSGYWLEDATDILDNKRN